MDTTHDELRSVLDVELLGGFRVVVDGQPVADDAWSRRQAAGLVKLLALAPGGRLHREQVIDALWPDDLVGEAAPKLHKAAHYARRALGVADAIVVRGEQVALCPGHRVDVDVVRFEHAAREALARADRPGAAAALELHRGELLPGERYTEWVVERREHVRSLWIDLLRLDERWEDVTDAEPGDEEAHVALMRRHAAGGDRHAALRQFERLDRHLRHELGVGPGRDATALRDELLADRAPARPTGAAALVGRARELALLQGAVADCAAGSSRTVFVHGRAGIGKSALLTQTVALARAADFRVARGVSASIEGRWPFATVVEALADLCRQHPTLLDGLADVHRDELDRALAGVELEWSGESSHQRLFVAAAELVRLASATSSLLLVLDDLHEADDASLRLLHYIARSTHDHRVLIAVGHRSPSGHPTLAETRARLVDRHGALDLSLGPLGDDDAGELVRRTADGLDDELVAQIVDLADGVPFALGELARRATDQPSWALALDVHLVAGVDPETRQALQRVAVVGSAFDTDEFIALSGRVEEEALAALDRALEAEVVEPVSGGYRFRHALVREALVGDLPPHRARTIHSEAAARLIVSGASPARIGHHLMEAGRAADAVSYLLRAAETEAAIGAYRDALGLVDAIRPHATGALRGRALSLRGDLLNAIGDPAAASAYREALDGAAPADVPRLRARLARSAVMSGDLETAAAALDGLEPDGGDHDADILLARGTHAFFVADFATAAAAAEDAQQLILAGQQSWKVLDLVSLQGLLAHHSGTWFDRMRLELRRTRAQPEIANAIFDGHLCATEFVLYGPTPYEEVIQVAGDLKATARRSGALRAAAFAAVLIGEAALLSGDLPLADRELTEATDLHRDLGSPAGEAVSMQRLAEVRIAQGEPEVACELLQRALPLARASMVANHLMQRIFGSLVVGDARPRAGEDRRRPGRVDPRLGRDVPLLRGDARRPGRHGLRKGRGPRPRPPPPRGGRAVGRPVAGHLLGGRPGGGPRRGRGRDRRRPPGERPAGGRGRGVRAGRPAPRRRSVPQGARRRRCLTADPSRRRCRAPPPPADPPPPGPPSTSPAIRPPGRAREGVARTIGA